MRKVIVGAMVSLDGVMQAPGGPQEDPTGGFSYGGWLASDIVDEINMFTFPIVLGEGKKLFDDGAKTAAFRLNASRVSPNGIVIAQYVRAGAVKTGDYAMDPPTQAEVARREKMQREG